MDPAARAGHVNAEDPVQCRGRDRGQSRWALSDGSNDLAGSVVGLKKSKEIPGVRSALAVLGTIIPGQRVLILKLISRSAP
jgi:hypothetical protein